MPGTMFTHAAARVRVAMARPPVVGIAPNAAPGSIARVAASRTRVVTTTAARELAVPGCHPTISGAPFLEVAREGVTKASGLASVCTHLGIDASEVMVFGDNVNDVEMLRHLVSEGMGENTLRADVRSGLS